ncbi:hypothetical protein AVEN_175601-1 [Araneus ventricosus]|uniref:Uncharacterized protein n=1 Tax=Araneus ventricosus TaxID=182803 RepID=A0A4Y2G0S2_ARAVE|nr:hypothetical protein AVEN_175601-1 [Araneus ventricosus]
MHKNYRSLDPFFRICVVSYFGSRFRRCAMDIGIVVYSQLLLIPLRERYENKRCAPDEEKQTEDLLLFCRLKRWPFVAFVIDGNVSVSDPPIGIRR